jgi:predicted pyridoxine 5'-phosphate oxidase superfamily flavin-nucleotide-binding protein
MEIPKSVVTFFERPGYVLVSSLDAQGAIHCSAKGIVRIDPDGKIFIADLYLRQTHKNLKKNPRVSLTAIEERTFIGYSLQGTARIIPAAEISLELKEAWETRIIERMSQRVVKGVQAKTKSRGHFEAGLPRQPLNVIEVTVENIVDLSPP